MNPAADLRAYWRLACAAPIKDLIANASGTLSILNVGNVELAVVRHSHVRDQSNVCSLRTHYVTYAREESAKILSLPVAVRSGIGVGLGVLGALAHRCPLEAVVTVNNPLLTTCLYPALDPGAAEAAARALVATEPTCAIVWRSVTPELNPTLVKELHDAGARLLPWRSIYLHDPTAARRAGRESRDAARDLRLLDRPPGGHRWTEGGEFVESDWKRVAALYRQLYLEKYSRHNPAYTAAFFALCHRSGCFRFHALRAPDGQLAGFVATYRLGGVQAAPFLGYDLSASREHALYRLLCARHWREAMDGEVWLHQSAGVADFKRSRRATPAIEYVAVFYRHLPLRRRIAWRSFLEAIRRIALPLTRRYEH